MVKNDSGDILFKFKFYDKIIDFVARDGSYLVGSRITEILGSKQTLHFFNPRVRSAQHTGIIRLEVSICYGALKKFEPWQVSVKTCWHLKVQSTPNTIIEGVLND